MIASYTLGRRGAAFILAISSIACGTAVPPRRASLYGSIADARAHLPAGCTPLYTLDGRPLADTLGIDRLPASEITTIALVYGTERGRCPVIAIESNSPR